MNEREIFMAALDRDSADERARFLDEACGDDPELRRRVEELLQFHAGSGEFLERRALAEEEPPSLARLTDPTGSRSHAEDRPSPTEISLDFLRPCDVPGRIGKIGPYEVIEVIGRGGMGAVLRAIDPKLGRVVAVKTLAPEFAGNPTARRRFLREARAAAAVSHPHVVTIHAVEEVGDTPYLVMEYVDGLTLQDKIERLGTLELEEILRIGSQIAGGLAAAHGQGLIHRDVKPGNVLLENGVERVKLTDFGLARAVDDVGITRAGEVAGTPEFMSPEQAQGHAVDTRSDLFALGSVLYAMCTGRSPFRADTTVAVLRRVCDDPPRPIREVNPQVPAWLSDLIETLLQKNPEDRIQTAAEVEKLLVGYLAHVQDPGGASLPPPVFARRPKRRRPTWLVVAAAVILMLAAGLGLTEATGVTEFTASVIRVVTGEGTLVVEVDDPEVSLTIDGRDLVITGAGPREVRLKPGQYELRATRDGNPVKTELVTIDRGGRQVVTVGLESPTITPRGEKDSADHRSIPEGGITEVRRFVGHFAVVPGIALSADGKFCLSCGIDQTLRLWNTQTAAEVKLINVGEYVQAVTLSPNGKLAACQTPTGRVGLWDLDAGKQIWQVSGETKEIYRLVFSPDALLLGLRTEDSVQVWDVRTRERLLTIDVDRGASFSFSANGKAIVFCHADKINLWDIDADRRIWTATLARGDCWNSAFSPDGRLIANDGVHRSIEIRDAKDGSVRGRLIGHTELQIPPYYVFAPDGEHLVSVSVMDHTMIVWSTRTMAEVARRQLGTTYPCNVVITPDGRSAITCGGALWAGKGKGWIPGSDYDLHQWQLPQSVWPKESNQTGNGAADYKSVPPGSITRVRQLAGHTGAISRIKLLGDGHRCLTRSDDRTVRLWEINTSRLLKTFRFSDCWSPSLAAAPGQQVAATEYPKGTILLFNRETGESLKELPSGHSEVIWHLEFSPDGRRLLSRSRDETLRLWDVETGKELRRFDCRPWWAQAAAFSPDGGRLLYGDGGFLVLWDIKTESEVWRAGDDDNDASHIFWIAVSADGQIAATSTLGGPIHLWDASSGKQLGTLVGHPKYSVIAFTPDGRHFVSGNNVDKTLRVWSVENFTETCRIDTVRAITNYVAVLPDGQHVISGGGNRHEPPDQWIAEGDYNLHVWRLPESVWPKDDPNTRNASAPGEPIPDAEPNKPDGSHDLPGRKSAEEPETPVSA